MVLIRFVGHVKVWTFDKIKIMKKISLTFAGLTSIGVYAQQFDYLDINNINARINNSYTSQFMDPDLNNAAFEAPKGSGISTIYASSIWIGGLDSDSLIHVAGSTFSTGNDFRPGPIMDSIYYASQYNVWNKVWKINK